MEKRYTDREGLVQSPKLTPEHLSTLAGMRRLCGKTTPQIEREIFHLSYMADDKLLFIKPKMVS